MIGISTLHFAIRLLLAIAMGATVGLERQWRQRMAGTRTNALVAAGAAAFAMCGLLLDNDPSARGRIVSYIVSGVGFLGAGVIFKDGASVRGLNTAATIWCSAAIGTYWARFFSTGSCACVRGSLYQHGPPATGLSPSPRPPRGNSCRNTL